MRQTLQRIERGARRAASRSELGWRYGPNVRATWAYRRDGDRPAGEAERVLNDLDRDGVAITSLDALVGERDGLELHAATDAVRRERANQVEAARQALARDPADQAKPFVVELLGEDRPLDPASPLARFLLLPPVVQVVNAYFGMQVRLRYYDVWQTLVTSSPASQSQLWHRDPEDRAIVKVFVALDDVDEGAGPFTYAAGSHHKGDARRIPEYVHRDGPTGRSTDEQMAAVVPPERWITATGPKGTVIFADTHGFHRGGRATERERVLFVGQFMSRAAGRGGIPTG